MTSTLDRHRPHPAPRTRKPLPAASGPAAWRVAPVALAAGLALVSLAAPRPAHAQPAPTPSLPASLWPASAASAPALGTSGLALPPPASRLSFTLPTPGLTARGHNGQLPLFFEADKLEGEAGVRTRATGAVRLTQGELRVRADELTHTVQTNTATAQGRVRIDRNGDVFRGPSLTLKLDTLEGEFIRPEFWFARTRAGGKADRVEFLGNNHLRAYNTSYSSCTPADPDGVGIEPDWSLKTRSVDLNFDTNEGRAESAVVWFKGVPILAAPSLTFPLNDQRKSGWLPPTFQFDSKSGFELSAPYYWNIAPDKDLTLAPIVSVRRGVGLDAEYRYLTPSDNGVLHLMGLPDDRVAGRSRGLIDYKNLGQLSEAGGLSQTTYELQWLRVSDDDYWKDFAHALPSLTPRLYDSHITIERQLNERNWGLGDSQTIVYGGVQSWQTLRDLDPLADPTLSRIDNPYRREPQLGVRSRSRNEAGLTWRVQGEFNRFTNADTTKVQGNRVHAVGQLEQAFNLGGVQVTPRLSLNSTHYDLDASSGQATYLGPRSASRTVPTFSIDSTLVLERPVHLFSRDLIQTLEPRVQYVRTPYRDQSQLPLFDSAPRDFNQYAIFSENAFTGVDRISDADQVTLGVTSRVIDPQDGAEAMRLGLVQKVLLADQRINPNGDGPITQRLSDLLLLGSTSVIPHWSLNGTVQFKAQNHATAAASTGVRYAPGAYRTVGVNYRYTRDNTEQIDLGWQWPLSGQRTEVAQVRDQALSTSGMNFGPRPAANAGCSGAWYSVGRLSYSRAESRLTDSLVGVEYDAGCWIGRVVAQRVSVGRAQANTRIMFQLELVGLSRISLGANPLRALKDNIPGYTLLRDDSKAVPATGQVPTFTDD